MYVLLLSLTTTILEVFAFIDYYQTRSDMQEELNSIAEVTASKLSKSLATPLYDLNDAYVDESLQFQLMEKKIFAIT